MRVNTKQAVKLFFTNPSLEQVFKEAIANSLDANATKIDIRIYIDSLEKQETLQIEITDNGEGFTNERYDKFCELLKVEEDTHKGVGRLVYLSYFNEIEVSSYYDSHHRIFTFNDDFDKERSNMQLSDNVDGEQRPIKLDKSELTFPSAGGEQTVTAVNYNSWWISGGYKDYDHTKNEYTNYVYPTSTDGEDACTYDLLDGGWYYVVVPDKGESNQVVITVSENNTSTPRYATITMRNRNAFTNISIQQE